MLSLLTKQVRGWAAGVLVAAYAFGVLAPSLVFCFDSQTSIIHSLTESHGGMLLPHVHDDKAGDKNSDKRAAGGGHHCCGVVALPGLPPPTGISVADQICMSLVAAVFQDQHAACDPMRLDRPPRHLPLI
jgi:hypothetical protein